MQAATIKAIERKRAGAKSRRSERRDDAGEPERRERVIHRPDLANREFNRRAGEDRLGALVMADDFEEWPPVRRLPQEAWRRDQSAQGGCTPKASSSEYRTSPGQHQPQTKPEQPDADPVFGLHSDARDDRRPEKSAVLAPHDGEGHEIGAGCPGDRLERGGRCDGRQGCEAGREGRRRGRQNPRNPLSAQQPSESRRQRNKRGCGERRRQSERPHIFAERLSRCGDQGRQRRLIDVTKRRTPSADDEIEFVSENVVAAGYRQVDRAGRERQRRHIGIAGQEPRRRIAAVRGRDAHD